MYFGWNFEGVSNSKSINWLPSFGVVENRIAKRFSFSDKTRFGMKFICEEAVLLVGIGIEQLIVRQIATSLGLGFSAFASFFLQHFIGHTFLSIPPFKNGVPAGTLATSKVKIKIDVAHLVILFLLYFNDRLCVNLNFGVGQARLTLIFAASVFVGNRAIFI